MIRTVANMSGNRDRMGGEFGFGFLWGVGLFVYNLKITNRKHFRLKRHS